MGITVLIADDHRIVREGLKSLLGIEPDIKVIDEAEDGREAVRKANERKPEVVIMDISMPQLNGVEATRQILHEQPATKVIALSMHTEHEFIRRVLNTGASAYLYKDCAADELVTAIHRVKAGKKFLGQDISDLLFREFVESKWIEPDPCCKSLSNREQEVLQLITEGNSTKKISEILFISVKTVESHRKNIMDKLQLFSISELTKYAIRNGITTLE